MIPFVYRDLGYARGDFPVAERLADEVLSLPMFPELADAQIDAVTGAIRASLVTRTAAAGS